MQSLKSGDFFRPLLPGTYSVLIHKPGFHNQTESIEITAEKPTVFLKFNLFQVTPQMDIEDELMEEEEFVDTTQFKAQSEEESIESLESYDDSENSEESQSEESYESESEELFDFEEDDPTSDNSESKLLSFESSENKEDILADPVDPQARTDEDVVDDEDPSWESENSSSFVNILVYGVTTLGIFFCCIIFYKKRAPNSGAGTFQFNKIGVQESGADEMELRKSLLRNRV